MCDFIDGAVGRRYNRHPMAAADYGTAYMRPEEMDHSCEDVIIIADGRPSPGSTTLEDVLDSLLGLPPVARPTSPAQQGRTHV